MTFPPRPYLVVGLALTALLAGCGGSGKSAQTPNTAGVTPSPSASPLPSSAAPTTPSGGLDPLTGLAPRGASPVVVLKIDNAPLARPYQRGLSQAAIVFEEVVEGGSTRMLAVFDNGFAGEVGPVRSVRESDPELLGQLGPVALGFSGGNSGVTAGFHAVVRAGRIFDASYDAFPGLYRLGERRADARNFFTTPGRLAAALPAATKVRESGLRFGAPVGGSPAASATTSFSAQSTVRVVYSASTGRWTVFQDGRQMSDYAPANIIFQQVQVRASQYSDVHGENTPYTVSVGSGQATVLRDGVRADGMWKRGATGAVTRYVDKTGKDLLLRPGPTLVLLIPAGRPLTVG